MNTQTHILLIIRLMMTSHDVSSRELNSNYNRMKVEKANNVIEFFLL